MESKLKIRKARKRHWCDECNKRINIGDVYAYRNIVFTEDTIVSIELKECPKCIQNRAKRKYKKQQHEIRANNRRNNCPDADFQPVWNGGWDVALGCPDGGDIGMGCYKCNLLCSK